MSSSGKLPSILSTTTPLHSTMDSSHLTGRPYIYRRGRRTPDGWPTARGSSEPHVDTTVVSTEAESDRGEDMLSQKPGLKYLKELFVPVSTSM